MLNRVDPDLLTSEFLDHEYDNIKKHKFNIPATQFTRQLVARARDISSNKFKQGACERRPQQAAAFHHAVLRLLKGLCPANPKPVTATQ